MAKASLPKGFRDFLPAELYRRQKVIAILVQTFQRYGFEPLETPTAERIETLMGKYGEEGDQLIFKILKRGDKAATGEADLALRYDLTVPLARVVAMYGDIPRPFKRYQVQPVWRADRPQKGRYREFTQCDVDVVGSLSPLVETELLAMTDGVFRDLGFTDHTVRVNNRQLLSGVIRAAGVPEALEVSTIVALDKLDKVGLKGVEKELVERGVTAQAIGALLPALEISGTSEEKFEALARRVEGDERGMAGLQNLRDIFEGLGAAGVSETSVVFDPFLARGLSYYTGAVFETNIEGYPFSFSGGGRYDELIGMFMNGRTVPACGTSFGLGRILLAMEERDLLGARASEVEVMVSVYGPETRGASLALASELRAAGLKVDLFSDDARMGQQFKYAEARGIPLAVVLGPDEIAGGTVAVKDLARRSQENVSRDGLVAALRGALEG